MSLDRGDELEHARALARILAHLRSSTTPHQAYEAGLDCGRRGARVENCDIRYFASSELTAEWERGRRDGELERRRPR